MSPKDIFGLVVRIAGLAILIWGVESIVSAIGLSTHAYGQNHFSVPTWPVKAYYFSGFVKIIMGYGLIRGALLVENFAYPNPNDQSTPLEDPRYKKFL